nr:MAG TPA: hypothetical protein [Caudoviricetes sp.]
MKPFTHASASRGSWGLLPDAVVNGFFVVLRQLAGHAARRWWPVKQPRDTSKPERGRWAKPRAGW